MKRSSFLLSLLVACSGIPAPAALPGPALQLFPEVPVRCVPVHRSNSVYSVLEAAAAGDVATLEARLAEGDSPSEVDELGNSPLHYAARGSSPRALELLLAAGADAALRDACGRTPRQVCRHVAFLRPLQEAEQLRQRELELADHVAQGNVPAVRAALAAGVNPNALTADNRGPLLLLAIARGHAGVVQALLEAGADVNAVTRHGRLSALHIAATRGDAPLIRTLLEAKADPMLQAENGAYPLHDAVWARKTEAVRALLPAYAGSNFNPSGGPHGSPLSMAISYKREACVRAFVEAGFNPNDERLKDEPPLILAVRSGSPCCVQLLLEAGADKQVRDAAGKSAVDYASAALEPLLR